MHSLARLREAGVLLVAVLGPMCDLARMQIGLPDTREWPLLGRENLLNVADQRLHVKVGVRVYEHLRFSGA